jgi:hypothetical protein
MQLRAYENTREAMKSDKEREKDAKPSGEMAELVAKVQFLVQRGMTGEEIESED